MHKHTFRYAILPFVSGLTLRMVFLSTLSVGSFLQFDSCSNVLQGFSLCFPLPHPGMADSFGFGNGMRNWCERQTLKVVQKADVLRAFFALSVPDASSAPMIVTG